MLQHPIYFPPIICQVVACGKVENERKFQMFRSESDHGRLQEVVTYKKFQI